MIYVKSLASRRATLWIAATIGFGLHLIDLSLLLQALFAVLFGLACCWRLRVSGYLPLAVFGCIAIGVLAAVSMWQRTQHFMDFFNSDSDVGLAILSVIGMVQLFAGLVFLAAMLLPPRKLASD